MSILPMIGVALASAATAGVATKTITDSRLKKLKCDADAVESGGKCVKCLGGSSTLYDGDGVEANRHGCYCPPETGWDTVNNRCVHCPAKTFTKSQGGTGGEGTIRGCRCKPSQRWNAADGTCVDCTGNSFGAVYPNTAGATGCYCGNGYRWDSTSNTCESCLDSAGLRGVAKDGTCTLCLENSNTYFDDGMPTSVGFCNCNNGYLYSGGKCNKCPGEGSVTSHGKCCPAGSSFFGTGDRVADECYCLPYHRQTNGRCEFTAGTSYIGSASISANDPPGAPVVLSITAGTIPTLETATTNAGKNGITYIAFSSNKAAGMFLKGAVVEYTTTTAPTTAVSVALVNARDIFIDNYKFDVQAADVVDPAWVIRRLRLKLVTGPGTNPTITISFIGALNTSTRLPTYITKRIITLSPNTNYEIAINIT